VSFYRVRRSQIINRFKEQVPALIERPVGPGYVKWEDVYVSGDTIQQTLNRVQLDSNNKPQVLTLPEGVFEFNGFNEGYYEGFRIGAGGAAGCKGIWGSGRNSIIRPKKNSATKQLAGTIAGDQFGLNNVPDGVLRNFSLRGTEQNGLYYTGVKIYLSHNTKVDNLYLRGASPGYSNAPPGETFGINVYQSSDVTIQDTEIDGRDDDGNRVCSSPIGWNGSGVAGSSGNLARNAVVKRVYTHHSLSGMLTFWQTYNVYTEDYHTYSNASGPGALSGTGINHEESNGVIRHIRPILMNNGAYSGEPDRTGNTGGHMSMNNTVSDMADFRVEEPIFDTTLAPSGGFCTTQYANYQNTTTLERQKVTSPPVIIYKGVELAPVHHPNSGWGGWPKDQYQVILH